MVQEKYFSDLKFNGVVIEKLMIKLTQALNNKKSYSIQVFF